MAQIRVDYPDFSLHSYSTCQAGWTLLSSGSYQKFGSVREEPTTDSKTVVFEFSLPAGAKIKSAKVHSTWGSCLFGYAVKSVAGLSPDSEGFVEVAPPAGTDTSLSVSFQFRSYPHGSPSSHADNVTPGSGYNPLFEHTSAAKVGDVYLLLEVESAGGIVHRAEGGKLVPYRLCRAEGGKLVPYRLCRAEGGKLVPY